MSMFASHRESEFDTIAYNLFNAFTTNYDEICHLPKFLFRVAPSPVCSDYPVRNYIGLDEVVLNVSHICF